MRAAILRLLFLSIVLFFSVCGLWAQEISGISTLSFITSHPPDPTPLGASPAITPICKPPRCVLERATNAYVDTEEDYTASLYYNVTSSSAIYKGGSSIPAATKSYTGNPSATGHYLAYTTGLMTEVTAHLVDFFYITSVGEYYDPYGFSVVNSTPDGDYDSGYWFSVYVYATYITEASVILGEDYDTQEDTQGQNVQGPNVVVAMYQNFISPDYVYGPPVSTCLNDIYAGDNLYAISGSKVPSDTLFQVSQKYIDDPNPNVQHAAIDAVAATGDKSKVATVMQNLEGSSSASMEQKKHAEAVLNSLKTPQ